MTRKAYLDRLFSIYSLVSVLSGKNECQVLRVRNKASGGDMVVHSLPKPLAAYEKLRRIACENLPLIFDAVELEDGQIVLEEFIEGVTVAQVMESGQYRYLGARRVLKGVCRALTVLHERGLVHRDVKPENVLIGPNGRVVLIDFNASRQLSAASRDTVVMGTVGYASPEQLGVAQSDARTDIYAAGVLLNVMLTGKHPSEQMARGYAGRIVRKCTQVNPNNRYPTAAKLADALALIHAR